MPVKYICTAKGYSLSFIVRDFNGSILIKENDIILDRTSDVGLTNPKDDKFLSFGKISFICDADSFKKYFVELAVLRDKRIDEILND
jgi:hypothetical protein